MISAVGLFAADCLAIAVAFWCRHSPRANSVCRQPGANRRSRPARNTARPDGRLLSGYPGTIQRENHILERTSPGPVRNPLCDRGGGRPWPARRRRHRARADVRRPAALCRRGDQLQPARQVRACIAAASWRLPIVVIGNGPSAAEAEAALTSDPLLGYRFVGRVDPDTVLSATGTPRLWPLLERYGAARLLIALDVEGDKQRQVIECALREQVPFAMVPQPDAFPAFAFEATRFFGQNPMLLSYRNGLSRPGARMIKAAIDVTVAALMLVLSSFLFLILAVASRLDGGPMLFAHRRVGAGGRPFYCLKFRTMVVDADRVLDEALARDPALAAEWAASRKLVDDPRVTRLGRILRKTSLDELPQLINVLRLEMSLVGPRPIVEAEVPLYGEAIAQYYATRPGLTGLWQVSGRSNTSYARRVQLDVWYVNNWTIWNDIAVLFKTIPVVLGRQGAH